MKIDVVIKSENLAHARGGEVVLYKRGDSKKWQARFKLKDLKWHRLATKQQNLQYAAQTACEAYDRARFLFEANVPISSKRFDVVARLAIEEMEGQIASGNGKTVYNDYITVIKKYLIPFFGSYNLTSIGYEELQKFGTWRVKTMGRTPVHSTITTHNSAINRVFDVAIERGWIAQAQVPKFKNNGKKGTAREAFSLSEYKSLVGYMPSWIDKGHTEKTNQMRRLLRDYVLVLSNTGIQANVNASVAEPVLFKAVVNKLWLEKVNALFVSGWLREYGERITWAKHNMLSLGFDSKGLVITHYGERGNFSNKSLPIEFAAVGAGKAASVMVLSKDILPLLSGLVDVDIVGKVTISVTENCIAVAYATELADYQVFVPTCSVSGKRSKTAFSAYGG